LSVQVRRGGAVKRTPGPAEDLGPKMPTWETNSRATSSSGVSLRCRTRPGSSRRSATRVRRPLHRGCRARPRTCRGCCLGARATRDLAAVKTEGVTQIPCCAECEVGDFATDRPVGSPRRRALAKRAGGRRICLGFGTDGKARYMPWRFVKAPSRRPAPALPWPLPSQTRRLRRVEASNQESRRPLNSKGRDSTRRAA
jgi:hypothetical protein